MQVQVNLKIYEIITTMIIMKIKIKKLIHKCNSMVLLGGLHQHMNKKKIVKTLMHKKIIKVKLNKILQERDLKQLIKSLYSVIELMKI